MKCRCLIVVLIFFSLTSFSQQVHTTASYPKYEFVPNHGQWHPLALYKANIPYGNLYLESTGMVYDLVHPDDYNKILQRKHDNQAIENIEIPRRHSVRLRFEGIKYAPKTHLNHIQEHYYNFYLGSDKSKWATKLYPGGEVVYDQVYEDIDFEITGINDIKYQWVVYNPTSQKIKKIKTVIEGAEALSIENGTIKIKTTVGTLIDDEPYVYQEIDGEIIQLNCSYTLQDSTIGYTISSEINPNYPLIIDPKLIFSTYSGSVGDNFGYTATYDSKGSLYAGGIVNGGEGPYPITSGVFDPTWNGGEGQSPANLPCDISLSKYDSAGSKLLWATYLGGSKDEYPHSLVVDRNDDLLVLGTTYSPNFPTSKDCFDSTHAGGTDILVSKISEDGTKLLGSTFIGGERNDGLNENSALKYNYSDDFRGDILTDDDGNIFVASCTFSDSMPVVAEIQSTKSAGYDGYAFELTGDCKSMLWGTYLGGGGADALYSIKLDNRENIFIGGGTSSTNLPTSDTVYSKNNNGKTDGILAIFNKTNKSLKRLTYWGTEEYDQIYFIDIDAQGRVYATGQTEGDIKQTPGTFGESSKGQFFFRIDTLLEKIDIETTFGNTIGAPNLTPSAFLVDVCEHIYFSGWGSNVDPNNHPGNSDNMPISADAEQKTTDGNDFYVIVLDKNASGLLYATYFGGNVTGDHVDGGTSRFDKKGVIYQSVCSSCPPSSDGQQTQVSDFPTSAGAVYETNPSVRCSNASFKIDLQIKSAVIADFIAYPTIGCGPLLVQLTNRSTLGDKHIWDFGDGTTSSDINPSHTFDNPGIYTITLTVIDSNTCNISSVYTREIQVLAQSVADFTAEYNGCENELIITNKSINGFSFRWDFGDGNSSTDPQPSFDYKIPGDYDITLFVNEGTLCESQHTESVAVSDKITPQITLYNVFTPNDDDLNDCFKLDGKNLECKDFKMKIYNRWGEKVFEANDPYACWNGRRNSTGNLLPSGTYFYLLWFGNKNSAPISGQVEVVY
ncbi:PKD domain-containing protein [Bacteroidia bacterium]|nr:PKD domain-containing protein [Bacteroidia bacterium]MDB4107044.1 PKD domain-containing protein [Bacteroidia bacterium]MDB9882492.1 PKD domain-containing protein [Bacteroidia bacterium]MDC1395694.1 PKD domain-containing protein [Bacteroidia bacterium]